MFQTEIVCYQANPEYNDLGIYWSDSSLENWRTFAAQVENAVAIAWDSVQDRIYWSDIRDKKIYSATRNGTDVQVFIGQGLDITEGIAVDWVGRNLYWVDSSLNTIEIASLEKPGGKLFYQKKIRIKKNFSSIHSSPRRN